MTPEGGNPSQGKLRVAMYWASSCGGCDISLLEIGPHLLEFIEVADIVFWPCATDFKYADVAGYDDGFIDVCLFNGAIRSSEHEEVARLLRRKSKSLVAYGACATEGGIPSLANLSSLDGIYDVVYRRNPSLDNPGGVVPETTCRIGCGDLELPRQYDYVLRLRDIVEVDYQIPGCPPQAENVWKVLSLVASGQVPLEADAVKVGCGDKAVCDECSREKKQVKIAAFKRPHLAIPDPRWCLLEQGFVCSGPATRSGCGALCVKAGLPCRGCYGPAGLSEDQGTAMVGVVGSSLDAKTEEKALEMVAELVDPIGTFYRFSVAASALHGAREAAFAPPAEQTSAWEEELLAAADGGTPVIGARGEGQGAKPGASQPGGNER
ncbi:MAG: oxidoreductase [Vicinamibacterales bacterium]